MNSSDALINMLSQKLGTSPETLKKAIQEKDMSKAIKNLSEKDKETLRTILNNKEIMQKLMSSKEAGEIKKNIKK